MSENTFLDTLFNSKDFSLAELELILPRFSKVIFSKNDFLLEEGKTENAYWFIESGFARSYVTDTEGNDITTNFYASKDIVIDWTSFFLRMPARENIQALTECICWGLDYDSFQQLFHSIESFREQGRTRLVNSYFALKKHSISIIADQARERYIQLLKEKPYIVQNVPLKQIATYLGITDTSLSRIRKELASE